MKSTSHSSAPIRFDGFELDPHAGELRKAGAKLRLPRQPLQILHALLERPGEVVTREELQRRVWPTDTFVDFENGLNNAIKRIREALGDMAETPRYIETLPRVGYRFRGIVETTLPCIKSLAVLPLENLSHDPEKDFLAEGLTEALINTLAKIGALRVVSRTSVMQYKGTQKSLPEIARELNVDGIIEGTVQHDGDRLRISAQLLHARTDTHIWAESYDRDLRDLLSLQSEVAQAIAREVRVKLSSRERADIADQPSVIPAAYDAYLKGRYYWNRRAQQGFEKALQFFNEAIAIDPGFAAAHAGLADVFWALSNMGFLAPHDGLSKAKKLALRAVELDESLAEAHASLAIVRMCYDFDFASAEQEFERALALNPRYSTAHSWFGYLLACIGRNEEGYTECVRALRLDPLSLPGYCVLGVAQALARRFEQSEQQFQKALEYDSSYSFACALLSAVYLMVGRSDLAIDTAKRAVELSPHSTLFKLDLAEAYAVNGRQDIAREMLSELQEVGKIRYVTSYLMARTYVALGEREQALTYLEASYEERSTLLLWLRWDPLFDPLRDAPRFQEVLRRMNFPE